MYPRHEILLGKHILWQIKKDGSNARFYLDDEDYLWCGSRNQACASQDLRNSVHESGYADKIRDLLLNEKYIWHSDSILFAEILQRGKSPTRIEMHEKDDLVIFDMYGSDGRWISYSTLYQKGHYFDLPITETLGSSYHTTMSSLYRFRDKMLDVCREREIEGVVGKTHWLSGTETPLWFKEKQDLSSYMKKSVILEENKTFLPPLPYSEIMGAIEKVYADIGLEKFRDVHIAMPLCAQYVNEESKKHFCAKVKNPFEYYRQRLEDILESK
jgi:hypothetical protein